ncbi:MAG: hypothetical protein AB1757_04755 [Acidobacteriota bacterium]
MSAKQSYAIFLRLSVLLSVFILLGGCAKPETTTREVPVEIAQPVLPAAEPQPIDLTLKLPPPTPTELQQAVNRLYKDTVMIEAHQFLVGDFNGDHSQDLAVIVKPAAGKHQELSSEVANWILEDPQNIPLPDPTKPVQPFPPAPAPVRVEPADRLLAILHGFGQEGWRSPQAIQTYLLKNAVGNQMMLQDPKALIKTARRIKSFPQLRGEVIQQTLDGKPGFLYYTGAKYVWRRLNSH